MTACPIVGVLRNFSWGILSLSFLTVLEIVQRRGRKREREDLLPRLVDPEMLGGFKDGVYR
jgi:hypothetical protein